MKMTKPLHTVVEMPEFIQAAKGLLSDTEREELIDYLASGPDAGAIIPGTGGARKLRWAAGGKGKRGGARVITFFSSPPIPVFLLSVFGKAIRTDMSKAERNELKTILKEIADTYSKRNK